MKSFAYIYIYIYINVLQVPLILKPFFMGLNGLQAKFHSAKMDGLRLAIWASLWAYILKS